MEDTSDETALGVAGQLFNRDKFVNNMHGILHPEREFNH